MTPREDAVVVEGGTATPRPWRQMRDWPLCIVTASEERRPRGASVDPERDREYAHPLAEVVFHDITVRQHPEVAAAFPHRRVHRDAALADAALIVSAVNAYDRLRRVEAAARALVDGEYGLASGVVSGPDPRPEDFTYYVPGGPLAALRAALSGPVA